ncbi:MAG: TolC family outer membrane protein [Pseudomonadota bacterium]
MAFCLPANARSESLGDTLAAAYENSGLIEQNRALLRAADEDVAQIVSSLRPILNWSVDLTRNFSKVSGGTFSSNSANVRLTAGVSLELLLFDFGQTKLRLDAAKETVLSTRETLRGIEQQVLLRAATAFFNVNRNLEFVDLRRNNLRLLQEELRAARDRFEVGEVTRTDVAQAQARLAAAQSGLAEAEGDLTQAVEEFRSAVGRSPGRLNNPRGLPVITDLDAAKSLARRNHPDILSAQREVAAADFTVMAAEADVKPRVSLDGQIGVFDDLGENSDATNGSFGVTVTGPIYQGGLLSSAIRQAMSNRDAARGNLHFVQRNIVQDVGNAYAVLRAAQASLRASGEQVRAAEVAFEGVREEATLGARTTLDVLDAEQELLDAKANLISADADVFIAAYQVLTSVGQMTARDLRLNVQLYDPSAYYNLVKDAPVPISPQGKKLDRVLKALGKD